MSYTLKKVSYSKVTSYLSCPYKHYLGYVKKLRQKKPVRPLTFGGDFHKLLENRGSKDQLRLAIKGIKKAYNELSPKFQEELGPNYIDDLKTIFSDYRKMYKDAPLPVETEHEFLVPMGKIKDTLVLFHGKIDEVYEDLTMGEHKTFNRMPGMGVLAMNVQANLYSKAWELITGEKFKRVQWDYIKSTPAMFPIWLEKSERFSTSKTSNVTPYSFLRAAEAQGHDITSPETIKAAEYYRPNLSNFFWRTTIELTPHMVDSIWADFREAVKDLVKREETNKMKNVSRDCEYCSFRPICYAEFTGADVQQVIDKDFEVKKDQYESIHKRNDGTYILIREDDLPF